MTTSTTPSDTPKIILDIEDLTVAYRTGKRVLEAVRNFSLQIEAGQTYGLVGESGSGKSTLALAVMRYLSADGLVKSGKVWFDERDLLLLSDAEMRAIWGYKMALVPQDPFSSLNPSIRIGEQLAEGLRLHEGLSAAQADRRAVELLGMVHLADPAQVARSYPHQISGGMQQRVMIAMALSTRPRLLILDEPTTALDVTTEATVLDLICELIEARGTSALYVTHNLGVVAGVTDRVAVLYASELVEDAPTEELFRQPLHPYTQGLLDSVPRLGQRKDVSPLQGINGQIPSLKELPGGCLFAPRCPLAIDICHQERPKLDHPSPGHRVRCHRWPEILAGEVSAKQASPPAAQPQEIAEQSLLELEDVKVHYPVRRALFEILSGAPHRAVKAVDGIQLILQRGKTLGIVGESGSGKTSLARAIIGLVERTSGKIELLGFTLPPNLKQRDRQVLGHLQMVFQNPEGALNPYMTIGESLQRPLITLLGLSRGEAKASAHALLEAVRLPVDYAARRPSQLSGGEKQRVAIARAFATHPDLLIADEPVSALDVSVQASILNLLNELQLENETTTLFISHDIAVVAYLADEIAVMYLGNLMEITHAKEIFTPPYHPYTEALLSAIPAPDPSTQRAHIRLQGDIPSPIDVPSGCPFHTRCPRFLGELCVNQTPPWRTTTNGKRIFCHIPVEQLETEQDRVVVWLED